jgi:hypothetical protein
LINCFLSTSFVVLLSESLAIVYELPHTSIFIAFQVSASETLISTLAFDLVVSAFFQKLSFTLAFTIFSVHPIILILPEIASASNFAKFSLTRLAFQTHFSLISFINFNAISLFLNQSLLAKRLKCVVNASIQALLSTKSSNECFAIVALTLDKCESTEFHVKAFTSW